MILGFTGTREGMTVKQTQVVNKLLHELNPTQVIHGDCIGADTDFHNLVLKLKADTGKGYSNPNRNPVIELFPSNLHTRAHNEGADIINPQADPIKRDHDIANKADRMLACPSGKTELLRGSGTWATIRYTRKLKKILYIVYPDGEIA